MLITFLLENKFTLTRAMTLHPLTLTTILFLFPLLLCGCPIDKIGGNFSGAPAQLEKALTPGAKQLIKHAFADVDASALHDVHVHVVGLDAAQGTFVNKRMLSWWRLIDHMKTLTYLSGADVHDLKRANEQYNERLVQLIKAIKPQGKYHLLAFDQHYNPDGTVNRKKTEFYTANDYVVTLAARYPDLFVPVISVHPYRKDALVELEKWAKQGVRWVKWLPNAQGINAADSRLDDYYRLMKRYRMILLTHVGEEQAVHAKEDQLLGNPLLFRRPLDMGVTVVMAHCASLGLNEDLDHPGRKASSFELFMRMMEEPRYRGLLYGEISAITQFNRLSTPLLTLLARTDLHSRLLNGSDYPLPALNIIIQTSKLEKYRLITKEERGYLNEIYRYNPLLFDYVVKRTLRHPVTGRSFLPVVFLDIDDPARNLP